MKKIIYLLFLSHLPFYAQTLSISVDDTITSFVDRTTPHLLEIVYTSPMEESKFHNNNRNIIIRNDFELTIEEICSLLPAINEQQLINVIQFLFDNDQVGKFGNKYQWKGIK